MHKFLILLCLTAVAYSAHIQDCGSNGADVELTEVSNCLEADKACTLKRGTNASITIKFTPREQIKTLQTVVHGIIAGVPMPFPMPQPDACVDSGLKCPLEAGESYTYNAILPVKDMYPKIKVGVKWELTSGDNDIVCIKIPAKIE